jgi:hypothetical protein
VPDAGAEVHLAYDFAQGFNTDTWAFAVTATEQTPGHPAGGPIFGGLRGTEWRALAAVVAPLTFELGSPRCEDYRQAASCVKNTFYDLDFTYDDVTRSIPLGSIERLTTGPPLYVRLSRARVSEAQLCPGDTSTCLDCDDDDLSFDFWTSL